LLLCHTAAMAKIPRYMPASSSSQDLKIDLRDGQGKEIVYTGIVKSWQWHPAAISGKIENVKKSSTANSKQHQHCLAPP